MQFLLVKDKDGEFEGKSVEKINSSSVNKHQLWNTIEKID